MGIEGIEELTGSDKAAKAERETDQAIKDRQNAELDAQREEHNRRTAGTSSE